VVGYKKFYVNGQTSTTTGGGPDLNLVKPYQTTYSSSNVFNMPPYSVFFVVAKVNNLTSITHELVNETDKRIIPFQVQNYCRLIDAVGLKKVEILSIDGKIISTSNTGEVNTSKLRNGLYVLRASFDDKLIVNKFLKN
jgi:hypothetical protein